MAEFLSDAPTDLAGAKSLARRDRYKFVWWALGLVDADAGVDSDICGYIRFLDDNSGIVRRAAVQIKSGPVSVSQIRELKSLLERRNGHLGVFVCLQEPTGPMRKEAASGGFYVPDFAPNQSVPRIQILTIAELLSGKKVETPRQAATTQ